VGTAKNLTKEENEAADRGFQKHEGGPNREVNRFSEEGGSGKDNWGRGTE